MFEVIFNNRKETIDNARFNLILEKIGIARSSEEDVKLFNDKLSKYRELVYGDLQETMEKRDRMLFEPWKDIFSAGSFTVEAVDEEEELKKHIEKIRRKNLSSY